MGLAGSESPSAAFLAGAQHGQQLAVQHHVAAARNPAKAAALTPDKQAKAQGAKGAAAPTAQTLNDVVSAARQMAQGDITAQVNAVKTQQQALQDQAMQRAQQIQLASQAGAQFLTGIGDQTAASYSDAAKTLAGLASGFTGDLRATATNAANQVAQNLATLGAPTGQGQGVIGATQAQVAAQPTNLANILYNQGGFAPANLLETSGQAFAAAQRQLPAQTLAYGNQQAQGTLGQGASQAQALAQQIIDARATQPKLAQQYLSSLQQQILNNQLGQSLITSRETGAQTAATKLDWQMKQGSISNQIKQFNADTARWKAQHPGAAASASAATAGSKPSAGITKSINDGFLHSADGNKVILNGKPIRVTKDKASGLHGLTPYQVQTKSAEAQSLAAISHAPVNGKPGVSWLVFLRQAQQQGLPTWLVIQEGRKVYSADEIKRNLIPGG